MIAEFPLGQLVATPGGLQALAEALENPAKYLSRHASGDWGDLCAEDRLLNDRSVLGGGRIFSAYCLPTAKKIWIITEADRSATTILLPDEY